VHDGDLAVAAALTAPGVPRYIHVQHTAFACHDLDLQSYTGRSCSHSRCSFPLLGSHKTFPLLPIHAADLIGCEVRVVLVVGPADVLALWAMAAHDAKRRSMCCNLHRATDALHCDRQLDVTRGPAAALHGRLSLIELQVRAL
jgi:hypothetical protein